MLLGTLPLGHVNCHVRSMTTQRQLCYKKGEDTIWRERNANCSSHPGQELDVSEDGFLDITEPAGMMRRRTKNQLTSELKP